MSRLTRFRGTERHIVGARRAVRGRGAGVTCPGYTRGVRKPSPSSTRMRRKPGLGRRQLTLLLPVYVLQTLTLWKSRTPAARRCTSTKSAATRTSTATFRWVRSNGAGGGCFGRTAVVAFTADAYSRARSLLPVARGAVPVSSHGRRGRWRVTELLRGSGACSQGVQGGRGQALQHHLVLRLQVGPDHLLPAVGAAGADTSTGSSATVAAAAYCTIVSAALGRNRGWV